MRVKSLPTILALHLKRFKYMEQFNRHIKVSHRVVFPLELRLFNTVFLTNILLFDAIPRKLMRADDYDDSFYSVGRRCKP